MVSETESGLIGRFEAGYEELSDGPLVGWKSHELAQQSGVGFPGDDGSTTLNFVRVSPYHPLLVLPHGLRELFQFIESHAKCLAVGNTCGFNKVANNASMFAVYAGSFSIKSKGTGS